VVRARRRRWEIFDKRCGPQIRVSEQIESRFNVVVVVRTYYDVHPRVRGLYLVRALLRLPLKSKLNPASDPGDEVTLSRVG
jgi:hypothetical protein